MTQQAFQNNGHILKTIKTIYLFILFFLSLRYSGYRSGWTTGTLYYWTEFVYGYLTNLNGKRKQFENKPPLLRDVFVNLKTMINYCTPKKNKKRVTKKRKTRKIIEFTGVFSSFPNFLENDLYTSVSQLEDANLLFRVTIEWLKILNQYES